MRSARPACCALLLFAACATHPGDPYVVAESALCRHDLAGALQALDAVPVAHPFYPRARAAAIDVERDMRRCHELMLQAMLLRSEWRDVEALEALQRVRSIWPAMPGVDVLIAATEQRRKLFTDVRGTAGRLPAAPSPAPAVEPAPAAAGDAPRAVAGASAGERADAARPLVAATPVADDPVALALVAVEARLSRGQLETAVVDLLELARRFPADLRVRTRLVRLLQQRALLRYGDGTVTMAVADWQRILELDPDNEAARRLLEAVEREGR